MLKPAAQAGDLSAFFGRKTAPISRGFFRKFVTAARTGILNATRRCFSSPFRDRFAGPIRLKDRYRRTGRMSG